MKRLFFIFGGLMLLALTACVNEKISIDDQFAGEKITVKAYMPEGSTPSTRVSYTLNDDNNPETNDPFVLSWSENDAFSVIRGEDYEKFTKTEGTNDFTGTLPTGTGDYYAVYPPIVDNAQNVTPAAVPFDISNQMAELPFLMYASSVDGNSFHFKHALAYLKLRITVPLALVGSSSRGLYIELPDSFKPTGTLKISDSDPDKIGKLEFTGDFPYLMKEVTYVPVTGSENNNQVFENGEYVGIRVEVMFAIPPMPETSVMLHILDGAIDGDGYYYGTYLEKPSGTGTAIVAGNYYTADIKLYKLRSNQ